MNLAFVYEIPTFLRDRVMPTNETCVTGQRVTPVNFKRVSPCFFKDDKDASVTITSDHHVYMRSFFELNLNNREDFKTEEI